MRKILVIDDMMQTTDVVKMMLMDSGFECTTVNNGKDGFELIKNGDFDVVLLDLAMPEITGVDILTRIRDERIPYKHKIILFTASPLYSNSDIEKLRKEFPIMGRIRKPFSRDELVGAITKILEESSDT